MRVPLQEGELATLIRNAVDDRYVPIHFDPSGAWVESDEAPNWVMMMIGQMRAERDGQS